MKRAYFNLRLFEGVSNVLQEGQSVLADDNKILLTQAGFTNFEALRAATAVNAQILGIDRELGTIQPGKLADFIVLKGNPLEDITCLRNILMVVKDGEPYREGNRINGKIDKSKSSC